MKYLVMLVAALMLLLAGCESNSRTALVSTGAMADQKAYMVDVDCDNCVEGCEITCEMQDDGTALVTCTVDGEVCCTQVCVPRECTPEEMAECNGMIKSCAPSDCSTP